MLIYATMDTIEMHTFLLIGGVLSMVGFVLSWFSYMYFGTMALGMAYGLWWITPALVLMDEVGSKSFAAMWGTMLTAIFWGIFFIGLVYEVIWVQTGKDLTWIYGFLITGVCLATFILIYSNSKKN